MTHNFFGSFRTVALRHPVCDDSNAASRHKVGNKNFTSEYFTMIKSYFDIFIYSKVVCLQEPSEIGTEKDTA